MFLKTIFHDLSLIHSRRYYGHVVLQLSYRYHASAVKVPVPGQCSQGTGTRPVQSRYRYQASAVKVSNVFSNSCKYLSLNTFGSFCPCCQYEHSISLSNGHAMNLQMNRLVALTYTNHSQFLTFSLPYALVSVLSNGLKSESIHLLCHSEEK